MKFYPIYIGVVLLMLFVSKATATPLNKERMVVNEQTDTVVEAKGDDVPPEMPMDGGEGKPMGKPNGKNRPPMGFPGKGHDIGAQTYKVSKTGLSLVSGTKSVVGQSYSSLNADENAVLVKGGALTLKNCKINKNGADSDNGDGTSFYGTNAAVLATGKGEVKLEGGRIATNAVGANAIVAYGGTVNVKDLTINCQKNLSRGIHATGGGTIHAQNLTITTCGNNSSVIATDRGGGNVTVDGGNYTAKGKDCAVCYSTGNITVNDIQGYSEQGEVGVIEGDNQININHSTMKSGDSRRGMMILQSGSGDAQGNNGRINVTGGSVTLTSAVAPLIEITTSTQGTLTLTDVKLDVPSGILLKADYNQRWHTTSPIANLVLSTASKTEYAGNILVDSYATTHVKVNKGVTWSGAYDTDNSGKLTSVEVSGTWVLTANSNVDSVKINEGGKIDTNGHELKYQTIINQGVLK